jgi:parallel beta-helix repeat protein
MTTRTVRGLAAATVLVWALGHAHAAGAATLYVRVTGDDARNGSTPATALRTIGRAARLARAGDRVVVGPGRYAEGDVSPTAFGQVSFVADRRGTEVGDLPGDVVLDATGFSTGFRLNSKLAVTIDGFVIYGAVNGIYVKSRSDQTVLLNNVVSANRGNGIYIQDSKNVSVFNNLVYNNVRTGILVTGNDSASPRAQLVNNTVVGNGNRGIFFAGTRVGSSEGLVVNNVTSGNAVADVQVNEVSRPGYRSATNVIGGTVASGTPLDVTDRRADPALVAPAGADGVLGGVGYADDDFHLRQDESPAVDAGSDRSVLLRLHRATTRCDGRADRGIVDAGYHYDNFGALPSRLRLPYATIYVSATGGSDANDGLTADTALQTVARALELAAPGNEVRLLGGTYREGELRFARSGREGRDILLQAVGGAIIDATGSPRGLVIAERRYLTLIGVHVTGASDSGVQVIAGSSAINLTRATLRQNGRRGLFVKDDSEVTVTATVLDENGRHGVQIDSGRVTVSGSWVRNNLDDGLLIDQPHSVVLEDTVVTGNHGNGTWVRGGAPGQVTLRNCRIDGNGRRGLASSGDLQVSLQGGTVQDNASDGVEVDGGQFVADGVAVALNEGQGILVSGGAGFEMRGCVVHANAADGVNVLDAPAALVVNNLVYANGSSGLVVAGAVSGSPGAQVLNNTFYGNRSRGVLIGGSDLQPPSGGALVLRNIFQGNGVAGLQINQTSLTGFAGDYNMSADRYGPFTPVGSRDLIGDPRLVRPAGVDGVLGGAGAADDDFHLSHAAAGQSVTSPAVDAGGVTAIGAGLAGLSTRTDAVPDTGLVDLGYHYAP